VTINLKKKYLSQLILVFIYLKVVLFEQLFV